LIFPCNLPEAPLFVGSRNAIFPRGGFLRSNR
jgi:hypothetical protein